MLMVKKNLHRTYLTSDKHKKVLYSMLNKGNRLQFESDMLLLF